MPRPHGCCYGGALTKEDRSSLLSIYLSEHRLQIRRNSKESFRLRLDLFHCYAVCNLHKRQAFGKVDVENTLSLLIGHEYHRDPGLASRTKSVIIMLTQALPVRGNSHCLSIFGRPFLSVCSMVTTTFVCWGFDTRSMAPPKPLTLPGNIPSVYRVSERLLQFWLVSLCSRRDSAELPTHSLQGRPLR